MSKKNPGKRGITRYPNRPWWYGAIAFYAPKPPLVVRDGWIIQGSMINLVTGEEDVVIGRGRKTPELEHPE